MVVIHAQKFCYVISEFMLAILCPGPGKHYFIGLSLLPTYTCRNFGILFVTGWIGMQCLVSCKYYSIYA